MPEPHAKDSHLQFDTQLQNTEHDRRAQPRSETILSRIEDATYTVLRRHEKKPA
jgi:hypothetical protein